MFKIRSWYSFCPVSVMAYHFGHVVFSVVPLTQLVVGSSYVNACPINDRIPIYLIVSGVVGLFIIIITLVQVSFHID